MTKKSQTIKQKKVMNFTTSKKESLFNKDTVDENGGEIFFFKWASNINKQFTAMTVQIANKYMKEFLASV